MIKLFTYFKVPHVNITRPLDPLLIFQLFCFDLICLLFYLLSRYFLLLMQKLITDIIFRFMLSVGAQTCVLTSETKLRLRCSKHIT